MPTENYIYLWIYLAVINSAAFLIYGLDKYLSKTDLRRIPEKTLLLLAGAGGSLGAYLAMQTFRHKTRHAQFYIGVPVMLVAHCVIIFLLLR